MKDYPQMREETLRLLSDLPQDEATLQRMVDDLYEQDPAFERVAQCAAKRSPTHMTLEDAQFLLTPQSPDETANYIGCFLVQGYMGCEQLKTVQGHLTKAWMDQAKPDVCWSGSAKVDWNLDVGPVRDVVVRYQVTVHQNLPKPLGLGRLLDFEAVPVPSDDDTPVVSLWLNGESASNYTDFEALSRFPRKPVSRSQRQFHDSTKINVFDVFTPERLRT